MTTSNSTTTATTTPKTEVKNLDIASTVKTLIDSKDIYKESFDFIKIGSNDVLRQAIRAYYHIGEVVNYFSDNYTQKQSAALRTEALKDLGLSANEVSGCKKINLFGTCPEAVEAYLSTGKKSLNAARMYAAIRDIGKEKKEPVSSIVKVLTAAIVKAEKSTDEEERASLLSLLKEGVKKLS